MDIITQGDKVLIQKLDSDLTEEAGFVIHNLDTLAFGKIAAPHSMKDKYLPVGTRVVFKLIEDVIDLFSAEGDNYLIIPVHYIYFVLK